MYAQAAGMFQLLMHLLLFNFHLLTANFSQHKR